MAENEVSSANSLSQIGLSII